MAQNQIFWTLFELIQQSTLVTLSCLSKKNQNLNPRKKNFITNTYYIMEVCALKSQLSVTNWTFYPRVKILIGLLYKFKQCTYNYFWFWGELWISATFCHNQLYFWPIINIPRQDPRRYPSRRRGPRPPFVRPPILPALPSIS